MLKYIKAGLTDEPLPTYGRGQPGPPGPDGPGPDGGADAGTSMHLVY
jgi:hypothetical protein